MAVCPECGSKIDQIKHGYTGKGHPRYRCSACGRTYTPAHYDRKYEAVHAFRDTKDIERICRQFGVSRRTLLAWLKDALGEEIIDQITESGNVNLVAERTGIPRRALANWYGIKYGTLFRHLPGIKHDTQCPHCQSTENQTKKGRTLAGNQRYYCPHCKRSYTPQSIARSAQTKDGIRQKFVDHKDIKRVARMEAVSQSTVRRAVKEIPNDKRFPHMEDMFVYLQTIRRPRRKKKAEDGV